MQNEKLKMENDAGPIFFNFAFCILHFAFYPQ